MVTPLIRLATVDDAAAYRWSVDTSVYVDEPFRRRGIGHGLYLSLFAVLAAQGYANTFAGIALPSPASVALHERVGFAPVGVYRNVGYKLGAWHDVGWWQRSLARQHTPLPIRGPEEVRQREEFESLLASARFRPQGSSSPNSQIPTPNHALQDALWKSGVGSSEFACVAL